MMIIESKKLPLKGVLAGTPFFDKVIYNLAAVMRNGAPNQYTSVLEMDIDRMSNIPRISENQGSGKEHSSSSTTAETHSKGCHQLHPLHDEESIILLEADEALKFFFPKRPEGISMLLPVGQVRSKLYFIGNPDSIFSIGGLCVIETKLQFSDLPRPIMSGKQSLCLTESTLRVESHAN